MLQDFLVGRGNESANKRCHELMVKLAEDRFTLAVVGQFNRGKSSLMNAILGRELLPTGMLPLTSAITILRYGPRERLVIRREDFAFEQESPLSTLGDYVSQQGNPGNAKKVIALYVELPSPFLRRGLEFVDTPGIGSAIEANTLTTLSFIPECDAVLFVTSVDTPLADAERQFLQTIRQHVRKIFFVLNKTDLLVGAERQDVAGFVSKTLQEQMLGEPVKLFAVSARTVLTDRFTAGRSEADGSGIGQLKSELAEFLTRRKAETFLRAVLDKARNILAAESQSLEVQWRMAMLPESDRQHRLRQVNHTCDRIIGDMRESLAADAARTVDAFKKSFAANLHDFIGAEKQELGGDLHRAMLFWRRWQRTDDAVRSFTAMTCDKLKKDIRQWTGEQTDGLGQRYREIVGAAWQSAQAAHIKIRDAISAGFNITPNDHPPKSDDGEISKLVLSPVSLPTVSWTIRLSFIRRHLPVRINRRWTVATLQRGIAGLLSDVQAILSSAFETSLRQSFEAFSSTIIDQLESARNSALMKGDKTNGTTVESLADRSTLQAQRIQRDRLRKRLDELGEEITGVVEPAPAAPELSINPGQSFSNPVSEIASADNEDRPLYHDFDTHGCPACCHVRDTLFNFFAHWQYALASDESSQDEFARRRGFCPLHLWQLAGLSSPEGMSLGLPKLMEKLAREFRQTSACQRPGCQVCKLITDTEAAYIARVAKALTVGSFRQTYAKSDGLCVHHLHLLLSMTEVNEIRNFLYSEAADHFDKWAEDMRNYALKRQAVRRQLTNSDEDHAYQRALIHIAGDRYLSRPDSADAEI